MFGTLILVFGLCVRAVNRSLVSADLATEDTNIVRTPVEWRATEKV